MSRYRHDVAGVFERRPVIQKQSPDRGYPANVATLIAAMKCILKVDSRYSPQEMASKLKISRFTLDEHLKASNWKQLRAAVLFDMALVANLQGLTFLNDPQGFATFEDMWEAVIAKRKSLGLRQDHMVDTVGIPERTYRLYESGDYSHARRNLTLFTLYSIAKALGWDGLTFLVRKFPHNHYFPELDHANNQFVVPSNILTDGSVSSNYVAPDAPDPQALVPGIKRRELFIPPDAAEPSVVTHNDAGEPILHMPLGELLRVLRVEREARGLTPAQLKFAAPERIEQWEHGRVLGDGSRAMHDLTLRHLWAWTSALGFGRMLVPRLGFNLNYARNVLYHTTRKRMKVLGVGRNAALFGFKSEKKVKDMTDAQDYQTDKVYEIPALLFERWSYWAFADGIAFENSTPRGGLYGTGKARETQRTYTGWTRDEADSWAYQLQMAYDSEVDAFTRGDQSKRPRAAVEQDGRIFYPIIYEWSQRKHMTTKEVSNV